MPGKKPKLSPEEALSQIAAEYQGHEKLRGTVDTIIDEIRLAAEDCMGTYMAFARRADEIFGKYCVEKLFSEVGLSAECFEERILKIFRR